MRAGYRIAITIAALLFGATALMAQDSSEAPQTLGGFTTQGSVTLGYRFDDVKGYQPMFQELSGLRQGFRLTDVNMFGEAKPGANLFADSYSISATGLGGEPFETGQVAVSKSKVYDFRANWRQSYYMFNQNDNVVLPIAAVGSGLSTGLTSNHDWSTVRKFGNANLTLHATDRLRFNFDYNRTGDSGPAFTTRGLDFLNSPGYWGTFVRSNPYYLYAPLDDSANRFTGGFDYTYHSWSIHYNAGYQVYTEDISLTNASTNQFSIDPVKSSGEEPLASLSQTNYRRLTTPISEFTFVGKPAPKLEWHGSYVFYRYQGPATLDQSFNGIAPNAQGAYEPYSVSSTVRATVKEPDNIVSSGLSYKVNDWWEINADYRYSRFSTNTTGNYGSLFTSVDTSGTTPVTSTTPSTSVDSFVWRDGLSDFDVNMLFTPTSSLTIRPGIHLMKLDVESLELGQVDPTNSFRTKTAYPELSFGYQPSKTFSIRGDIHSFDNGSSYTSITPHTEVGGHVIFRVQPMAKVTIEDDLSLANDKLLDANFQNNFHTNAATVSYALDERFSIFAGFTYDSIFAAGDILYVRGTPPLADSLRDQEVDRVVQGGFEAKPAKYFGLRLTGNYDHSTGLGQLSGEPAAYGPSTWPLVTGTAYFNIPKAGRLSFDLQRTYYIEQIVTGNNFSANMLTIRWTRDF